ncbi:hypothetical protein [Clostridium diolis]|uniref:hypothetical protein n=1 Tax=Clostridium diolis TaxID=223919 RepID=UPI0015C61620|nr:hypothetical protein [Clostridium diolis]
MEKPSRLHDGEFTLTVILKCPKCRTVLVMSRITNKLANDTKKSILIINVVIGRIK